MPLDRYSRHSFCRFAVLPASNSDTFLLQAKSQLWSGYGLIVGGKVAELQQLVLLQRCGAETKGEPHVACTSKLCTVAQAGFLPSLGFRADKAVWGLEHSDPAFQVQQPVELHALGTMQQNGNAIQGGITGGGGGGGSASTSDASAGVIEFQPSKMFEPNATLKDIFGPKSVPGRALLEKIFQVYKAGRAMVKIFMLYKLS